MLYLKHIITLLLNLYCKVASPLWGIKYQYQSKKLFFLILCTLKVKEFYGTHFSKYGLVIGSIFYETFIKLEIS